MKNCGALARFWLLGSTLLGCSPGLQSDFQPGSGGNRDGGVNNAAAATTKDRDLFDSKVLSILKGNCASCHQSPGINGAPPFLGSEEGVYYATLVNDKRFVGISPDASLLITKGKHEGPAFTATQAADVKEWLSAAAANPTSNAGPPIASGADGNSLTAFGDCMNYQDYVDSGMPDLPRQGTAQDGGVCTSCHSTGMYVFLSNDSKETFKRLHQIPWLMKFALAKVAADGKVSEIIAARRFIDRGTETGHPPYTLTAARLQAVNSFFQRTNTRYKAGNCPPFAEP